MKYFFKFVLEIFLDSEDYKIKIQGEGELREDSVVFEDVFLNFLILKQ